MAKYNIYAVARGLNKETNTPVTNMLFKTWDEAKPYVVGVENARYKGFLGEDEANMWLCQVQNEEMAPPELKSKVQNDEVDMICKEIGVSRQTLIKHLEKKFVEEYKWMHNRVKQQGDDLPWS